MKKLSVTEASRSLSECVTPGLFPKGDLCHRQAWCSLRPLVPASPSGCNSHELADDLAGAGLSAEDRRELAAAVRKGRKALKSLKNPWG